MGLEKIRKVTILSKYQITHHSYLDILGLLKSLPTWFNKMGYYFYEKGLGEKDIGTGNLLESEWTATRDVTEYIQFAIEVKIIAKDICKIVLENGEELYWARLLILIDATVIKDFQNKFGTIWYEELMRQFYERYIVKEDIRRYLGKMQGEGIDLANTMRSHLR